MRKLLAYYVLLLVVGVVIVSWGLYNLRGKPLFSLDEKNVIYQIAKKEANEVVPYSTYYIVKIDPQILPFIHDNAPFRGWAMKIHGADFNLDSYLNKEVKVEGFIVKKEGIDGYFLTSAESVDSTTK